MRLRTILKQVRARGGNDRTRSSANGGTAKNHGTGQISSPTGSRISSKYCGRPA